LHHPCNTLANLPPSRLCQGVWGFTTDVRLEGSRRELYNLL
jgi:hypothetical protein